MLSHMPSHTPPEQGGAAVPGEFVGTAESSRILGVHVVTLTRWVAEHQLIPAHKLPGKNGAYVFRRADIERIAAERAEASA